MQLLMKQKKKNVFYMYRRGRRLNALSIYSTQQFITLENSNEFRKSKLTRKQHQQEMIKQPNQEISEIEK